MTGRVENMIELGVIQPKVVTEQVLRAASEAACMIVRIDDVISMRKAGGGPGGAGGPGGGPEMPEDMD